MIFSPADFAYDYFVKDHLGNVRMVLTDETQQDQYPAATMETAQAATEELFYANMNTRMALPTGYPPNTPSGNARAASVTGNYAGIKIGPAMILKVMAGDKFNVQVNSWYKLAQGQSIDPPNGIITELFNALNSAVGNMPGAKADQWELDAANVFLPGATTFVNNQSSNSNNNAPRAYLNWILFDEQFKIVSSSSGFEQVPEESYFNNGSIPNNRTKLHVWNNMPITKSGFLYIYVSNETPNIDVYFDNLQVTHTRGQILEETHYYPFGLTMAGISSKAAGKIGSKKKYADKELENKEFTDGSGLENYDFGARFYDPQIGKWLTHDPLSEKYFYFSPYSYSANNPILLVDVDGKDFVISVKNNTITISATYYAANAPSAGNASFDRAKVATEYINAASGKFSLVTKEGEKYNIVFDLKVVDETDKQIKDLHDVDNDSVANSFDEISGIGMLIKGGGAAGITEDGKFISVLGQTDLKAGGVDVKANDVHEIKHTLGAAHGGIEKSATKEGDAAITGKFIQAIFKHASIRDGKNKIDAGGSKKNATAGNRRAKKACNAKIVNEGSESPIKIVGEIIEN